MGGFGSGGHNDRGHGTIEHHRRIDAVKLQKKNVLVPGWVGTWTWTSSDGEKNFINLSGGRNEVRLSFRFRRNGGDWQSVSQSVLIEWSPRHYGGAQAYFQCPGCGSRVRYLYGADRRFLCRGCYRLVNASAREGRNDRVWRKVRKLRDSVGAEPGLEGYIPPRPRYMRKARYAGIVDGIHRHEHQVLLQYEKLLGRIDARRPTIKRRSFWS